MQPVFIQASPVRLVYPKKSTLTLAICQIFTGVLCIAFNAATIGIAPELAIISPGIWGGILMIIAGGLGVGASHNKGKCLVISTMVLSIISAVVAMCAIVVVSSMDIVFGCYWHCRNKGALNVLDSLLIILSLFETIVATWLSIICCKAVCGCQPHNQMIQMVPLQYYGVPQQEQQGQQVMFTQQMPQASAVLSASGENTKDEEKTPMI